MSKQLLDRKQMQHLHELGLDTSNASCYVWESEGKEYLYWGKCTDENGVPVFTLQDIIDILPNSIEKCYIAIGKTSVSYNNYRTLRVITTKIKRNLIDAAYEMLCWCIENGYINTNKED